MLITTGVVGSGKSTVARAVAARLGVSYTAVWCDAPDAILADRLRQRTADPREVSDAGPGLLARHRAQYDTPEGEPDTIRVDTTGGSDAAVAEALRLLTSSRTAGA